MLSTPPVPRVISTKEFAGAPVSGTKPFFGAELTWSEAYVTADDRSVIPETAENPKSQKLAAPGRNEARKASTSALDRVRRMGGRAWTRCQR